MNKENIDIIKAEGELVELYADEIPELAMVNWTSILRILYETSIPV